MRRRAFITGLVGAAFASPRSAWAQRASRVAKIGILAFGNHLTSPVIESFRRELRNLGYLEGRDIAVEFRTAAGGAARIEDLAAELVQASVDVIVTDGTPSSLAAKKATTTIPVVMLFGGDPVAAGLVNSYARPGGNITGISLLAPEVGTKRLEILKEAVPALTRVGVMWNSSNPVNSNPQVASIVEAARALGIEIEMGPVPNRDGFASAFENFKARQVSAVMSLADGMLFQERQRIVELAMAARLPGIFPDRPFANAGGLLFYGPNVLDLFKRAASYVDRILKGAKASDLPVEQPTRFEFVINLKTAKALGITMPPTLLTRADEVID